MKKYFLVCAVLCTSLFAQDLQLGNARTELYLPALKNKNIALVANANSLVGKTHLLDTLLSLGVSVKKLFALEHGFRLVEGAGEKVASAVDEKTGLPILSLYGASKKPKAEDLQDIDLILWDVQDVGVRFFTYLSSLHYLLEAAAEEEKTLMVLDRPNPNAFYIDGPVLDKKFSSFVGMHHVPVVYGMTLGEFAQMIVGEKWLKTDKTPMLTVIPCANYTHQTLYHLPQAPSPNLRTWQAIYLYPTLCFLEGTVLSEGRGTPFAFEVIGYPNAQWGNFTFTPEALPYAKSPKFKNQLCRGYRLEAKDYEARQRKTLRLEVLLDAYQHYPDKETFFLKNLFFDKLAGTDQLRLALQAGKTEAEIRQSWQKDLEHFKQIRAKYLLY